MAKTKTWKSEKGKGDTVLYLMCNHFYVAKMVTNAGLLIDPSDGYGATEALLDNLVDVLNREMPGGVARKHKRSKEKK